jgi:hypothetical protein
MSETQKKGIPPIQEVKRAAELFIKLSKQHKVQCPPSRSTQTHIVKGDK